MSTSSFQSLLQRFFMDWLVTQRGASPRTILAYRDTFRLLLRFASDRCKRAPSKLCTKDFDAALLGKFLAHLEQTRGNCARTRNNRLAAIHAFFHYVTINEPALALHCQRVLAIPSKRYERKQVEFLTEEEIIALVAAPDADTWIGQRDRALLLLASQTGLRNSEIRALRRQDVDLGTSPYVRCLGKGRKTRSTPLRPDVTAVLKEWLSHNVGAPDAPLFPSLKGGHIGSEALQRLVLRHAAKARNTCSSLIPKKITPHTLRHSAAMALLHNGIDLSVIALWLGHESMDTTQMYLHADMELKERALAHATESGIVPERYKPSDAIMAFLDKL